MEDREALREFLESEKGQCYKDEHTSRHIKADGSYIDVNIFSQTLTYEGRAAALVASIDVTERKRAADEVKRTREFLNTVIDNVPLGIYVKDARNLQYILINRTGEELYRVVHGTFIGSGAIIGKTAQDFLPKQQADQIAAADYQLLCDRKPILGDNISFVIAGKERRNIAFKRVPVLGENGEPQYLLTVMEDVTARKNAEEKIAFLEHHDPLTGLPNRGAFAAELAATLEREVPSEQLFAVLLIGLDRFKEVNDLFGHSAGDDLLQEVSRRLKTAAGSAFLARHGGDEFTLITQVSYLPSDIAGLAEDLLAAIADPFEIDGNVFPISVSIGAALYPADGTDATSLLSNADAALSRAKAEGRGIFRFFEIAMDTRLHERRALQHDLRSALERGELSIWYQPQASMDGTIIGFEALARWQHPFRGMVPPDVFISVAEESDLILSIGTWILREACREAASWPKPLCIAVNLSPVQFRHDAVVGMVHQILIETGLAAHRLEFEITEGVLIDDAPRALSILRRLKALGVRIAMDDFGTGYSSLSYIQSFRFDKIKIDRGFISNMGHNPQSTAIIRAIIGLAHGLQLPVIAEGVETEEQLAFLKRESCDEIQGYLIGRPKPICDYAELIGYSPQPKKQVASNY
jgi:diguanylate cyclase (GGDEF)-like protein